MLPGMRNALGTALMGVVLAGVAAAQTPTPPIPVPRLLVEAKEFDAGDVLRGHEVEASFALRNTGEEILRILSAKPG